MVFDINEIPEEGVSFEVRENKKHFDIEEPDCKLIDDVSVGGILRRIHHEIYLNAEVKTRLEVQCTRCLVMFPFTVKARVSAQFMPREKAGVFGHEMELHDADIDTEYFEGERIDITSPVRDTILLALPAVYVCRKDCAGLCPRCGINLNEQTCQCHSEPAGDPRLEILKSIKDKLK
ncbi:MAG: hypothetical protein COV67_06425 [Nitrospinae bacterium CG11_big_fil_rev_8_21_14_0_20_56_8]|nr:MAG: hypothetical protein COV67_06425 [Nitrospinae bacterium CG11_big_fil_rev_8_21_14_0_20_56_8]